MLSWYKLKFHVLSETIKHKIRVKGYETITTIITPTTYYYWTLNRAFKILRELLILNLSKQFSVGYREKIC